MSGKEVVMLPALDSAQATLAVLGRYDRASEMEPEMQAAARLVLAARALLPSGAPDWRIGPEMIEHAMLAVPRKEWAEFIAAVGAFEVAVETSPTP